MKDQVLTERIAELSPEKRALLFEKLQRQKEQKTEPQIVIPRHRRNSNTLPLSFAQQRLWFLDQYEPDSAQYNMPQAIRITGDLDPAVLKKSLETIVARHESLRTTFTSVDGKPFQVIAEPGPVNVPLKDLSHLPEPEREARALERVTQEAQRPFDLSRGPLMRIHLLKLDDDEHILVLNLHHIVTDGWSQGVFMHELVALYTAFSRGEPSPLPELPVQYADFAMWQRDWLEGEILEEQLSYWQKQLAQAPALDLPTDFPRPAIRTYAGTLESLTLSPSLTDKLKALSQQKGATLFMTLLAAFQTLLCRYTGQDDIPVGTLIANRRWPEIEGLIGFFANTLVMRTDLAGDPSFRELLQRVRSVALAAYAHQDLPFEKLVDELNLKRDISRPPLFQVMCILQNAPQPSTPCPGLSLSGTSADSKTAKFDLTLYSMDTPQGLRADLEYNTDLFKQTTARRILGHLQTLLEGAAAEPDRQISQLPILTDAEKNQLLVEWNDTQTEYPPLCVHQLFETQVKQRPDAVAVIFEGNELSYQELNERANRLAHYLRKLGIGPQSLVGICQDRSSDMLISTLGVLKAGGAYVPLDPDYPQERLAYMLKHSGLTVLLTHDSRESLSKALRDTLPQDGQRVKIVSLSADWDVIAQQSPKNLDDGTRPQNLAYVTYTSGSTGVPKGVPISHDAVVNFLNAMRRQPGLTSDDTLVAVTTLSFDISGLELFLPLTVGARVILASHQVASDGERLLALLNESGATIMQATPASWRLLIGAGWQGGKSFKALCGGEALPRDLANELIDRHVTLWNMYGPTETTIWSAACPIESKEGPIHIGWPIDNTQLYILDANLQPVPMGILGELYIGGDGLSPGYFKRPDLTAASFIPNPFSHEPGARLYKTGDLVRYLSDRRIEFLGRADFQVKVRGFRIELGEIEMALGQHPALGQTVVIAREDSPGDKRLVAYFVAAQEPAPTVSDLRRFLKKRLPDYMLPAVFMQLDEMPLTPNGKVNRRALPPPDTTRPDLESDFVAPRSRDEKVLAEIWAQFLGVARVGIHDNFFELGGDSLMVIRVLGKIREAGLDLTTRQFFEHQTIAELATAAGTVQIQAEQGLVTGPMPLTFAMHEFLEFDHPHPDYYVLSFFLQTSQAIDTALMEQALREVILHHDSMRLRLLDGDSGWQLINDGADVSISLERVDLRGLSEEEQNRAFEKLYEQITTSFDLFEGKLYAFVLFQVGPDEPDTLMLVGHYLLADVFSWQILVRDLDTVYRQLCRGEPVKLPRKTTSLKQWTERITEYAQSPDIQQEITYWLSESRSRVKPLPRDYPKGENIIASARTIEIPFSVPETQALLNTLKRLDIKLDAALLAATYRALNEWTGSHSLLIDLYVLGHESPFDDIDLSRTVGWLTFSYPLLLKVENPSDPKHLLESVTEQLDQVPNKAIGYPLLRYVYENQQISERMNAMPKAEVFFNFFGETQESLATFDEIAWGTSQRHDEQAVRPRLLAVFGDIKEGQLRLKLQYSRNVHTAATAEKLVKHCGETLRSFINL